MRDIDCVKLARKLLSLAVINVRPLCQDLQQHSLFEPPNDKTKNVACAPSEDTDQPGHPPSLVRVFAVRMKKPWVLSYPLSAQRRL